MDHQGMELDELINRVKAEMKKAHYSNLRIRRDIPIWGKRLKKYMARNGETIYTAKIGMNFLEAQYGVTVYQEPTHMQRRYIRAINFLTDYLLHGIIFPRVKHRKFTFHHQFQTVFQGYLDKKKADGWSESTLKSSGIYLGRFSDYLNNHGITNICDLNEMVVSRFSETFIRYAPFMIHGSLCSLRSLCHYLFQNGFVSRDFAYVVPHDGYIHRTKVPSAYSKEEVEKLLASIDRGNPKGKRDYAMILIAARLGLRAKDICELSFDNLKWETNTIELLQEKTGNLLILPLLEGVGLSIIDYLKHARPEHESKTVFLRLIPPMGKLIPANLHCIVTHQLRVAGVKIESGKKHGPHALRHSLASALLEANTPLPVISEVLGHTDTKSTSIYLKIDINQLRTCALEPLPFYWNQGEEVF